MLLLVHGMKEETRRSCHSSNFKERFNQPSVNFSGELILVSWSLLEIEHQKQA